MILANEKKYQDEKYRNKIIEALKNNEINSVKEEDNKIIIETTESSGRILAIEFDITEMESVNSSDELLVDITYDNLVYLIYGDGKNFKINIVNTITKYELEYNY